MKITFLAPALCAGLFMPVFPALASVSFQDIVTAATNPDDLSRQALVTIFGDVVTNPLSGSGSTLIGNLYGLFNGIIAILAVVWFMFIGLRHIVSAGHQGQVFGSGGRDIVGTLGIVSGFLMIVPTGNGWSLAQLIMLWGCSIMGVGSANLMVQTAADDIASGYSMTVQPIQASTRTAARGIFEMELCKYAINADLNDYNRSAKSSTSLMKESDKTAGVTTSSQYQTAAACVVQPACLSTGTERPASQPSVNSSTRSAATNTTVLSRRSEPQWMRWSKIWTVPPENLWPHSGRNATPAAERYRI